MKVTIVGPGAMGCLFAAFLSKSKEDIWLLDKDKERAQKISQQGIIVEGVSGNWQAKVKITSDTKNIERSDLVIIFVKAYDTKAAISHAKTLVDDNTLVLTLQNGIGNIEVISEVVGQEKVLGGVTNLGAIVVDTGRIRFSGKGETAIGRLDGKISVDMRYIRELFNRVGLETRISRDIKGLIWSKLIINAGINALSAVTRLNNGKLIELEWTRKILRDAVTEAIKVAKRKRIKLAYDDPLAKVEAVCEATATNISSMLQDVLKKRKTEIDYINGVIVRQGQESGVSVTVNSVLTDLVKTTEATFNLKVHTLGQR